MNKMENLETKLVSRIKQTLDKDYWLTTTCAWLYYGSVMTCVEFGVGMESKEVLKSRLAGAVVHATIMKPYGNVRKGFVSRLNAGKESSPILKGAIDISSMLVFQAPMYALMLWGADVSFEDAKSVYPVGLGVGAVQAYCFGRVLDKWKKLNGEKGLL